VLYLFPEEMNSKWANILSSQSLVAMAWHILGLQMEQTHCIYYIVTVGVVNK